MYLNPYISMQTIIYSFLEILNEMSPYILLGFFIAGLLHVFVSRRTMSRHLSGPGMAPVVKAALFGIPLPLCSCGVLPTAVSLRRNGASRGATTSFLIATPQTGVDSIAATYSLLGLPFAIVRPVAALIGSVFGGFAVSRFDDGKSDKEFTATAHQDEEVPQGSFLQKLAGAVRYGFVDMVASVGKWLVIGLIIAALITVFVPDTLFVGLSRYPLLAMIAVVIVAVPMYICATGSIPIALSLMMKGLSPGIAFVMLMAGPAANFASIMVLSRTQGRRATAIYVASVVLTAIVFGLIVDALPSEWFMPPMASAHAGCHAVATSFPLFPSLCSLLLVGLLINAAVHNRTHAAHSHDNTNTQNSNQMTQTYIVEGMACPHCKANVERAVLAIPGVTAVTVDLDKKTADVEGEFDSEAVLNAIKAAGYEPCPA